MQSITPKPSASKTTPVNFPVVAAVATRNPDDTNKHTVPMIRRPIDNP